VAEAYFESDVVTKDYDPRIARRIVGYLRPYKAAVAAAVLALAVSTAGELLVPVLVRRIVDEALMPSWYSVDPAADGASPLPGLAAAGPEIGGRVYAKSSSLSGLSGAQRRELERGGLVEASPYYVVDLGSLRPEARPAAEAALASCAAPVRREGDRAAIRSEDLKRLPASQARAIRAADSAYIARNAPILLAALVAILAATFAQIYIANLIGQRIMKDMRMELFRHASTRSLAFLSRQPVGRLVTRMTSDVETINQFFTDVLAAFLKDASVMVGVLVVLAALDWRLALAVGATLPPVVAVTLVSRTKARDAFRRQRQWLSKVNAYISERISGISVVKLFAREEASKGEFAAHDAELMRANLGEMYVYATFRPIIDFLSNLTTAAVIYVGAYLLGLNLLSLGTLIAFVNLVGMFYSPVMDISEKYTILQSAMAGGERVFRLLDADDAIPDSGKRPMPSPFRGEIEFDRVWFAYKGEEWVLRDLSFAVRPGETVAIVGYTGAGKTTIANLITRLWDAQRGRILVDGTPVPELPLAGLRRAVQPVPQDVFLFSGSIEDNIRLGPDVSEERMRLAASTVHADEFIERLDGGYRALLSEGATNLSQGQRQLVSFARVLAHDPAVVILDEATASIDTETERTVQRGLEALLAGRTSLVIAHRLSTIRHADRILVLSGGRIAEEGGHEALLRKRGLYWNLYRLQFGGRE
jgi:ATP-binding cassette subfamily B protein